MPRRYRCDRPARTRRDRRGRAAVATRVRSTPARACDHRGVTDRSDDLTDTDASQPDDAEGPGERRATDVEQLTEATEEFLESDDVELEDGQIGYECATWAGESRGLLESLLTSKEIPHVWQGTNVTVHEQDEQAVDELIDDVLASARPALDPTAPKIVYEVGVWPVALQTELVDQLTAADIAYEWDEQGDLVVRESDEAQVEEVLELLPDPDEGALSSDDGVAVHEILDKVFMSSDRLAKHATDASATVGSVESASQLEQLALPFGFEPPQWRRLVTAAQQLRMAIEGSDDAEAASDGTISELAAQLRDLVRQYI